MAGIVGAAWLEAVPDAVVIVSGSGLIVHANHRCESLLGWPPRDLTGRSIEVLVPDRFAAHSSWRQSFTAAPVTRPMAEGRELVARHRGGGEIAVDIVLSPVTVGGGDYVLVSMRDARAQRARLEELRLKSIALDEAASGIVVTGRDGVILWVNRAVTRMTGYESRELVGQRPSLLKSGAHDDDFYRVLWTTIQAGHTWQGAIINRRKDGSLYHEEQTIAPVRDADGEVGYFIAVKQDATDRIRAEQALRDAHAELARRVVEIESLQVLLREQVIRDPLTGLFNRRYFDETLAREVARAQRDGGPLTLAMIDLDHFKQVNDRYGHATGDRLLAELGRLLMIQKRTGDLACRYGGEEFAVVLLDADLEGGSQRAEEWRRAFAEFRVLGDGVPVGTTLSAGLAQLDPHESWDQLLDRADAALYEAKESGRDRVVRSLPGPAPER
jgi:diguanylate cyclase (GGDEF)-like protein/PAS domain S-box-containing protein